jgi:hypothetical protein
MIHVVLLPAFKILLPLLPSALSQCFLRFLYVTAHCNKFSISVHNASCFDIKMRKRACIACMNFAGVRLHSSFCCLNHMFL